MKVELVFFDLDDTLHKGDIFRSYLLFLARRNAVRLILLSPLVLPALIGYLMCPDRRWSVSCLLWILTVMTSEHSLNAHDAAFSGNFSECMERHSEPFDALCRHLEMGNRIYLVSGSPEPLVELVYRELLARPNVTLIGSRFSRFLGGRVLKVRCVLGEKVRQVQLHSNCAVQFKAGYSDSPKDGPLLGLCAEQFRVNSAGIIERWPSDSF